MPCGEATLAIVADSSVLIAHLRNQPIAPVRLFRSARGQRECLIGDVVLLEVLQGARSDVHAVEIEEWLATFPNVGMLGHRAAAHAAWCYRRLRGLGITLRGTADLVIGAYCIAHGHALLHADADFAPLERHCGLSVLNGET